MRALFFLSVVAFATVLGESISHEVLVSGSGLAAQSNSIVSFRTSFFTQNGPINGLSNLANYITVRDVFPEGLKQALLQMRAGDSWRVNIPSGLGYGSNGRGPIAPNTDLIVEVTLEAVNPSAEHESVQLYAEFQNQTTRSMAQRSTFFVQSFEANNAGFKFTGLWHRSSNYPLTGQWDIAYTQAETAFSTTADGNYVTGGANSGIAFGPFIAIPPATPTTFTYSQVNFNEFNQNPTTRDGLRAGVFVQNPPALPTKRILASTMLIDLPEQTLVTYNSPPYSDPANLQYRTVTLDLNAFQGQTVQIFFEFVTGDALANNYPGARIDDILVVTPVQLAE